MRLGNFEFVRNAGHDRDPEIVFWDRNDDGVSFRYTILWFRKDSEGWHIEFIGDRPLRVDDRDGILFDMMKYGQAVLDAEYRLVEKNWSVK
jgi:hypothetical protein